MDKDQNLYEIAYLISPAYSEEEANNFQQALKNQVLALGGFVDHEGGVLKRRLFYPIKKTAEAYAAKFRFTLNSEKIAELELRLKAPQVLRSIIVHTKRQPTRVFRPRVEKSSNIDAEKAPRATLQPKPEPAANVEEIDKKLEEILGK